MPLYGTLRPYSSHQISFTFYGHCDITAKAKALCEVEGGPTYEITLRGQASMINYSFDTKEINYGPQVLQTSVRRFSGFALNMNANPHPQISPESQSAQSHAHPCPGFLICSSDPDHPPQQQLLELSMLDAQMSTQKPAAASLALTLALPFPHTSVHSLQAFSPALSLLSFILSMSSACYSIYQVLL